MYTYHLHGALLAGYGWFAGKILYFNTQIHVYTFCLLTKPDSVAAKDFDGIEIILL